MLRLFISFGLALVAHIYFLQFQLNIDEPVPPQLISDHSVSVTLNQYKEEKTLKKVDLSPHLEPEKQLLAEPPNQTPAKPLPVSHAPSSVPVKPLEIKKENRKIKKELPPQPEIEQLKEPLPETSTKTDVPTVKKPVALSSNVPVAAAGKPVSEPATSSVIKARPLYQHNPKPAYPKIARRRGWEGTVMLQVEVDEKGGVASVQLQKSCGYEILDKSALKAVRAWRFIAGTIDGKPSISTVIVPIHFKLS